MKTRKFLIFAALLPLLLLLAGCGEKQAFNPVVFVAEHSADSLTNAAGERLQGDPELGFDNDATTMELGELYATQLNITHLVAYEIPRTAPMLLPGCVLPRNMAVKSGTPGIPDQERTSVTSGICFTIASVSRTARSVTSSGVPSASLRETLKVFLSSFGRNPVSTPKSDTGPEIPCGRMNCQAGIRNERMRRSVSAARKILVRFGFPTSHPAVR